METSASTHKVIALIDMDSFECQLYKRMYPELNFWGQAWIVADQTGRIVSATHEARKLGISREIRLREARKLARGTHLKIFIKPNDREKPDAKEVRYASWNIIDALKLYTEKYAYGVVIEYSSCDEFYLDITEEVKLRMDDPDFHTVVESRTFLETDMETYVGEELKRIIPIRYGCFDMEELQNEKMLLCGGLIMQDINNFLFGETKLIASVGVGSNKLMAKLAVNLNKPNGITILPEAALQRLGHVIKIEKIPGFGKTFGSSIKEIFEIATMNELAAIGLGQLKSIFGEEKGTEVFYKCRGRSNDPVKKKLMQEEISSGKTFHGQITSDETMYFHMYQLIDEFIDRLGEERERHKREPRIVKFLVVYTNNFEDCKNSWSHSSVYELEKSRTAFCDEVMNTILDKSNLDIGAIEVGRLEVRTKGWSFEI